MLTEQNLDSQSITKSDLQITVPVQTHNGKTRIDSRQRSSSKVPDELCNSQQVPQLEALTKGYTQFEDLKRAILQSFSLALSRSRTCAWAIGS